MKETPTDEGESQEARLIESDELQHRRQLLGEAMTVLNDRERHILTERRLADEPTTLEELSTQYGISRERVRQIEVRAFEKLQRAIRNAVIEESLQAKKAGEKLPDRLAAGR
jgi:RNA polymerase sigma-32 factor